MPAALADLPVETGLPNLVKCGAFEFLPMHLKQTTFKAFKGVEQARLVHMICTG